MKENAGERERAPPSEIEPGRAKPCGVERKRPKAEPAGRAESSRPKKSTLEYRPMRASSAGHESTPKRTRAIRHDGHTGQRLFRQDKTREQKAGQDKIRRSRDHDHCDPTLVMVIKHKH